MNRFTTRAWLAICGLVAAAALSACSAGQISQMTVMEPAVNGSAANVNHIALRDIRVEADQTGDALHPGKTVDLLFVATNQSPDISDSLVGITTDIGQVTVTGTNTVPPSGALVVGTADAEQASALSAVDPASVAKATVALSKPISNGMTYDFTFRFARAGETTIAVPITASLDAPRVGGHSEGGQH